MQSADELATALTGTAETRRPPLTTLSRYGFKFGITTRKQKKNLNRGDNR